MNQKIIGYPKYNIHNDGQVFSEHSKRFLNPVKQSNGYLYVTIGGKQMRVHRLVATAFLPNPESLPAVNHKNGIKHDNRVTNLEWCTNSHNIRHAFAIGLRKNLTPEQNHSTKLTRIEVAEIRELRMAGATQSQLAKQFGVSCSNVSCILNNKTWI